MRALELQPDFSVTRAPIEKEENTLTMNEATTGVHNEAAKAIIEIISSWISMEPIYEEGVDVVPEMACIMNRGRELYESWIAEAAINASKIFSRSFIWPVGGSENLCIFKSKT